MHHAYVNGINDLVGVGAAAVLVGAAFAVLVRRKDFYSRRRSAGPRPPVVAPESDGMHALPERVST